MKAWWLLVILVASASASPPPPVPEIERNCTGPLPWDKMQACIARFEQGTTIKRLSPEVKIVATADSRQYLFAQVGQGWRLASQLGDESYELVQRIPMMLGKQPAFRIDLSHHVPLGNDGVFLERVTHLCGDGPFGCQALVTACTVIQHGRAVETFRGELIVEDGRASVVGDRTHSSRYCLGR
jgi:hypothetical protein